MCYNHTIHVTGSKNDIGKTKWQNRRKSSKVNGSAAATGNQMVQMLTNLPQKHEVSALCLKP
jgi:hypothetical protein